MIQNYVPLALSTFLLLNLSCYSSEAPKDCFIPAIDDPLYQLKHTVVLSQPFSELAKSDFITKQQRFFQKTLPLHDIVRSREELRKNNYLKLNDSPAKKIVANACYLATCHALHARIESIHEMMDYYLGLKRLESIVKKRDELLSKGYTVMPELLAPESLQLYHYNKALLDQLDNGTLSPEQFHTLLDNISAIVHSDDPELLKVAVNPLSKQKNSIDLFFTGQIKQNEQTTASASSLEPFDELSIKKINPSLFELMKHIQAYITAVSKQKLNCDASAEITLNPNLEEALTSYAILQKQYREAAKLLHEEVENSFIAIQTQLRQNRLLFGLIKLGDMCQMHQTTQSIEQEHKPLGKQRRNLFLLLDFIVSFAATGIERIQEITLKRDTKLPTTTLANAIQPNTQIAIKDIPIAPDPTKSKKMPSLIMKGPDGSYVLAGEETEHNITIHSSNPEIITHIWKKRNEHKGLPPIRYNKNIQEWFDDPALALSKKRALLLQKRPDLPVDDRYTEAIHTFPRLVDTYLQRFGSLALMKSRKPDEGDVHAYWIPGSLTINDKRRLGIFLYIFDHNNICFHRLFEAKRKHEIFDCIESSGALNKYLIAQS